ncbi:MAG: DUF721 domain-containing protein [Bacteroidaceae bacterium]|nr:DUF721 domain-containing protein [Bacteroidaceae bacterium]
MKRCQAEPIGQIMQKFLREAGLETPLLEHRIVQAWSEVAGEVVASYTGKVYVRNGILHVQILSAPLRQNLMMGQSLLTQRLNAHVGHQVISSVRFF